MYKALAVSLMLTGLVIGPAQADNEYAPQMKAAFEKVVQPWLADAALIAAIKGQNEKNGALSAADIDVLDKQWRAEAKVGSGPLIDSVMGNAVSTFLKAHKSASDGLLTEVFVMDAKGLNVGQADLTTDYMQGDEAKWQKSYAAGSGAIFVDELDFDESSKLYQAQLSATIVDPATGQPIGAITVGMDIEHLE
jgi:hypothetical protein